MGGGEGAAPDTPGGLGGGSFGGIQLIVSLTLEVKSATIRRLQRSVLSWQISSRVSNLLLSELITVPFFPVSTFIEVC